LWPQSCETAAVFSEKASPFEPAPGFHELALIAYTSGTTGPSKGVMLSHARAFTDARADGRGYRGLTRVGARFAQWAGR
jgi:long-subunit acyl-CoA synthetase (AMP-forming)